MLAIFACSARIYRLIRIKWVLQFLRGVVSLIRRCGRGWGGVEETKVLLVKAACISFVCQSMKDQVGRKKHGCHKARTSEFFHLTLKNLEHRNIRDRVWHAMNQRTA